MKKIILTSLAALTLTTSAIAGEATPVHAKASKLKFSGTHYLGFNSKNVDGGESTGNFEMRRNYFQVKAYVLDDPKSYLRVTLDARWDNSTADGEGHSNVYVKYAYIYLDEVLPATGMEFGMEFGMVHRPWIDYEEHQGWWMRSISKVFVEASEASHLTNSADLGFNLKTKTPYFTSEVGVFNGEGYHGSNDDNDGGANDSHVGAGLSAEWRATVSALGNGEKKRKPLKDSYLDASFFGQYNTNNSKNADAADEENTYVWYGLHTVYNTPMFLVSAQYVVSENDLANDSNYNGAGYSVNGTYRFGAKKQYSLVGRYDLWESENTTSKVTQETNSAIYGVTYQQNKNVKWLLSGQSYKAVDGRNYKGSTASDWTSAMLTAEVHW